MKNSSLILLLTLISFSGFASSPLSGKCTPGSIGSGFSGTTTYCVGAAATALDYNYAECSTGSGGAVGTACTATWYYNTTNTTTISGSTVLVSGPTAFTSAAGANGFLPSVIPATTTAGTYYYFCVVTWVIGGTCTSPFITATQAITINALPTAIYGAAAICPGATLTLTDVTAGGTWSSSNTAQATIGSTTGIATGVGGIAHPVITYTLPTGCLTTTTITVNVLPAAITGTTTICNGLTTTLADAPGGGTWSSSNTAVATIGATHIATGVSAGTATISYSLATGCYKTTTLTINPNPAAITGTAVACIGSTTTLSDATAAGKWSSSNTAQATVGSTTGIVTYLAAGNPVIAYTLTATGCKSTKTITVNALPAAITGTATACQGLTTLLADGTAGGTWSSNNTAVATIGTAHIVTGITPGTSTITYTLATGCLKTMNVTVNQTPTSINGASAVCQALTITLTDATATGKWSSSNPAIATIGQATGIVTGVGASGNTTIAYTLANGCKSSSIVSINPTPSGITGSITACVNATTALSDATTGGTWSSGNTAIATIGSTTGILTGVAAGTSTITYTVPTGCIVTYNETVNPLPANITGTKTVCQGLVTNLTDATSGALSWTSSNTLVATAVNSGAITGVKGGTSTITYKISTGCYTTTTVTVTPNPSVISAAGVMCSNGSLTVTDSASSNMWTSTWTSSNASIATIGSATGVINGVNGGNVTITFSTGCGVNATHAITVNQAPAATYGFNDVCAGQTINFYNNTSGGTWTSSNTSIATIGAATGVITGVSGGVSTISYTLPNTCFVTSAAIVNSTPATVTVSGGGAICNSTTLLASNGGTGTIYYQGSTSGGTSTSTPASSQVISSAGTYYFRAMSASGCWSNQGSATVTVNSLPPITNTINICPGSTGNLSNTTPGGVWNSSNTSIAAIDANTGSVTGVQAGTSTITYTLGAGCNSTTTVTVNYPPTVTTGVINPVIKGNTSTTLHFYTTGTPTNYNITWCGAAHTAGFSDVVGGLIDTLAQDTILHIAIPSTALATMYTGTVSVTSTGCSSIGATIRAIVNDSLNIYTFAGTGTNGYTGDAAASTAAKISHPSSVAADCNGNTYIADYDNGVVRKVDARGVITTFAGNGSIGYSGDGGPATAAKLSNPTGVAIDAIGNVYIADYSNMVIRKVDTAGNISTFAGNGGHGYSGDGGTATSAELNYPVGLAVDNANNVYIADYLNSAIRMVSASGTIYTVAGKGTAGYSGDGSEAINAQLNNPRGVAVDASGNIYIADYGNNAIRKVNASGIITTIAGVGIAGYSGDGGDAALAQLNNPWGIAVDGYGDIYFSELHNSIIRKVDTNGIISTIAGNYGMWQGYTGDGNSAINAQLDQPMGIAINCAGNLYIADNANYAVRILGVYNRAPFFVGGATQTLNAYQSGPATSLISLLSVTDFDTTQRETWSIKTNASNGTLNISYSTSSTGTTLVPSGLTYTPAPGYIGLDSFTIQVSDGKATATTTVYVTVSESGARMSNTTGINNTEANNISLEVFPNPSRGTFNIKTSGAGTFYLFSMEGKSVGEYVVTDNQAVINIPGGLASGIYIGRFKSVDGNTTDIKLAYEQ